MHGKMQKKTYVILMIIAAAAFGALLSGCSGKQDDGNGLIELTGRKTQEETGNDQESKRTAGELQEFAEDEHFAEDENFTEDEDRSEIAVTGEVYVHVCGEVVNPGVYMLPAGSRIYEAIESAGGLREEAAGECLNQAAQVEDGQQIYVLSKEEAAQSVTAGQSAARDQGTDSGAQRTDDGKINLNTASKEQLMTLRGIGEAKAAAIISYREEHGGFQRIEELMEVEGIKEGVFNKVRDQVKI